MRPLSTAEVNRMRARFNSVLLDQGIIKRYVAGRYVDDITPTVCAVGPADKEQIADTSATAPGATVLFANGVSLARQDRFLQTHQLGVALTTPVLYMVNGQPTTTAIGFSIQMRQVL